MKKKYQTADIKDVVWMLNSFAISSIAKGAVINRRDKNKVESYPINKRLLINSRDKNKVESYPINKRYKSGKKMIVESYPNK